MLQSLKIKWETTVPENKLADRLREAIRLRGYSIRTEKAYVSWYERYVRFHKLRHRFLPIGFPIHIPRIKWRRRRFSAAVLAHIAA